MNKPQQPRPQPGARQPMPVMTQQPPMPIMAQQQPMPTQQPVPMANNTQNRAAAAWMEKISKIRPSVRQENPNYKQMLGNEIYQDIHQMLGPEKAPKITGMLLELQLPEIHQYLSSYEAFLAKV